MATTDIINTTGALFQAYPEMTVLLGPTSGDPPGLSDTFENVYCSRVVQSASGSRLDYADLVYALTDPLINRNQPESFSRMVDVRFPDGFGTLIARGDYVRESASVTKDGESLTANVQMRGYHFGNPLTHYDVFGVDAFSTQIHQDIVFNPTIDDRVQFNRSNKNRDGDSSKGFLWTHPESLSSTIGETWQGQTRNEWTLQFAVQTMCWLLNPDETFIQNPDNTSLNLLANGPELLAVKIPLGTRLHQALDLLLIPLGFNWYLDYDANLAHQPIPIKIFQIGSGTQKELYLQPPGQALDLNQTNLSQFSTDNNIGDSFNQVTVYGEFEESECTFPLFAAWDAAYDDLSPADLEKDGAEYEGKETVWRLFIANEAGDIEPGLDRLGQTPTVPELTGVFELWVPHRRTLQEPLTYLEGTTDSPTPLQQRRPHVIEWSDDSGDTWKPAESSWTIKICPDQIGILFDMKSIPSQLYAAGDTGRLRITGSVFGDSRINYTAPKETFAVNGRTVEHVLVRPDKFQYRTVNIAGNYQSVLTGEADTKDDTTEIQAFAEAIRDQNQYAEIDCEFVLPGWHTYYEIGDLITKINGREINLDAAPSTAPVNRYVQVTEIRYQQSPASGPSTVLIVDRGINENQVIMNVAGNESIASGNVNSVFRGLPGSTSQVSG